MCWIKLYRKFTEWEWYGDTNCKVVFLHLLLTANWKARKWQGQLIDVGELVTSIPMLAESVSLSEQQTRTALRKLKDSEVITCKTTNKYTIVKVLNYCVYQSFENSEQQTNQQSSNSQVTDEQQSSNSQVTALKELKNNRIINNNIYTAAAREELKSFKLYEQNIGVISPMIRDVLAERITAQGDALVSLAIGEAVKNNAKSIRYIEAVLNAWENQGVKSEDDAKLKIAERSRDKVKADDKPKSKFMNYPEQYDLSDIERKRIEKMMEESK